MSKGNARSASEYEAPRFRKLGQVELWTKGQLQGSAADASFSSNLPLVQLVVSLGVNPGFTNFTNEAPSQSIALLPRTL